MYAGEHVPECVHEGSTTNVVLLRDMSESPFQALAAGASILFLFLAVSRTPDFIGVSGVALFVGMAGLIATGMTGGVARAFTSKAGLYLSAFTVWLCVCLLFSVWKGGSFHLLKDTWSRSLLAFVIVGGALITVEQLRKAMYIMSLAAGAILVFSVLFGSAASGRLAFSRGTLANPNALAAYLLLTVPFCFFIFLQSKKIAVKAAASLITLMLLAMTLRTGSRSGLVSIGILGAYIFFSASVPKKLLMTALAVAMVISSPFYLPNSVLARFRTMVGDEAPVSSGGEDDQDRQGDFAEGSTHSRSYLLRKSIEVTISNPLFGVGPGMFAVASSDLAKAEGDPALWQQTHNTYTQVSSETGLPGLVIYLGLVLAILNATRIPPWATSDPEFLLLSNTAFTLRLSLIAFCGGAMFGSFAYGMELPLLAGLAETLRRVVESRKQQVQVASVPRPRVQVPLPLRPALR
jgi:O-antigen ligase